ncbi:LaaP [Lactobacillus kimbladii]|uniref:LaaP n=1 Tax=Lactobacillus kimbladii TaxID=1218506 RepID=A0A0F4LQS1_9LACO|nr:hypothetical protein [Lactobacillus kimbladii]KJY59916.1 LaaP [Lactobacillus kimbladii]
MQYKKPFYKKIWFYFVVVVISFFTTFVSGNTGIQGVQQTVIAKSTKVVKSNAKKVTVKRRKATRKRKQKKRKTIAKSNVRKVYIAPNSGRRYHFNPNCRGLRRAHGNITKISLKRASNQGYTLCKWED